VTQYFATKARAGVAIVASGFAVVASGFSRTCAPSMHTAPTHATHAHIVKVLTVVPDRITGI
jgi:hypothetical protein